MLWGPAVGVCLHPFTHARHATRRQVLLFNSKPYHACNPALFGRILGLYCTSPSSLLLPLPCVAVVSLLVAALLLAQPRSRARTCKWQVIYLLHVSRESYLVGYCAVGDMCSTVTQSRTRLSIPGTHQLLTVLYFLPRAASLVCCTALPRCLLPAALFMAFTVNALLQ